MNPTAAACRKLASQLARAAKAASFGGEGVGVRVREPDTLIRLLRRAARELDR